MSQPKLNHAQFRRWWLAGLPCAEIGQKLSRSACTVTRLAQELRLPPRRRLRPWKVTEAIRSAIRAQYGIVPSADLAASLGIGRATVNILARQEGCDMQAWRKLRGPSKPRGERFMMGQCDTRHIPKRWRCDCTRINTAPDCVCGATAGWKSLVTAGLIR